VKGQDENAVRKFAATLRVKCGEEHLGKNIGSAKFKSLEGVHVAQNVNVMTSETGKMTVVKKPGRLGDIVFPRQTFAELAANGAVHEGLAIEQATSAANEIVGLPRLDVSSFDCVIFDQKVDPKDFYEAELDPENQTTVRFEKESPDPGQRLLDSVSHYSRTAKQDERERIPDLGAIKTAISSEAARNKFMAALGKFAEIRFARPEEALQIDDPQMLEVLGMLDEAITDERLRDDATTTIMNIADNKTALFHKVNIDRHLTAATAEAAGVSQAVLGPATKELNHIAVMKPADGTPEAVQANRERQMTRLMKLVHGLESDEAFARLAPDARLNITEQIKKKAKTKGIALDDATRESIDRLHELQLTERESVRVSDSFAAVTKFDLDKRTGRVRPLSVEQIGFGMRNSPDLSPQERVTLYDRLLRNGYIEKDSPEAEAILNERRIQIAATGDARVYAVLPNLEVRDITAEAEASGNVQEAAFSKMPDARKDDSPEERKRFDREYATMPVIRKSIARGNFRAEPGTTIVVTRQQISPEDVSRRFQTQSENLEGIREELDRGQDGQTVIFKIK